MLELNTFFVTMKDFLRENPRSGLFLEHCCRQTMWLPWAVPIPTLMAGRVPWPQAVPTLREELRGSRLERIRGGKGDRRRAERPSAPLAPGSSSCRRPRPAGPWGRAAGSPRRGVATLALRCGERQEAAVQLRSSCCWAPGREEGDRCENSLNPPRLGIKTNKNRQLTVSGWERGSQVPTRHSRARREAQGY